MLPAIITGLLLGGVYVVIIRVSGSGDRDNPRIVVNRLIGTVVALVIAVFVTKHMSDGSILTFRSEELSVVEHLTGVIKAAVLTCILFVGNLAHVSTLHDLARAMKKGNSPYLLRALRDLVIAPVAEEIVFRGCFASLLCADGFNNTELITTATMIFWAAHFHHWLSEPVAIVLFKTVHTALFSFLSFIIWIKLKSIFAPIVCHTICNACGVPRKEKWQLHVIGIFGFIALSRGI